jgi:uncharacterized protein YqfB (UPF0267 family)
VILEDMADGRWTMTIKDVQESDFGTYRCVAENENGRDECEATLKLSGQYASRCSDKTVLI